MDEIQESFKRAMRHLAQSVAVLTTLHEGKPWGMTVSSFTSLSLNPPLILVCVSKDTDAHQAMSNAEGFAFNFLAMDQAAISDRFARMDTQGSSRFAGTEYEIGWSGPLLRGATVWIQCERWNTYEGGDHTLVVGLVKEVKRGRDAPPLLYYDGRYTTVSMHPSGAGMIP